MSNQSSQIVERFTFWLNISRPIYSSECWGDQRKKKKEYNQIYAFSFYNPLHPFMLILINRLHEYPKFPMLISSEYIDRYSLTNKILNFQTYNSDLYWFKKNSVLDFKLNPRKSSFFKDRYLWKHRSL